MLRLGCVVFAVFVAVALVAADPVPPVLRVAPVAPRPVELPILKLPVYCDPPGIIVSPIAPNVFEKCLQGTIKAIVPPPAAETDWLFGHAGHNWQKPFPSSPPTLRLPHWGETDVP